MQEQSQELVEGAGLVAFNVRDRGGKPLQRGENRLKERGKMC